MCVKKRSVCVLHREIEERTISWSHLSIYTLWVPEIELGSSGLATDAFAYCTEPSHRSKSFVINRSRCRLFVPRSTQNGGGNSYHLTLYKMYFHDDTKMSIKLH